MEDAAQAHGAVATPSQSAAVAYSFYPTKNLGGIGDGGAVTTNDAQLAQRVRLRRVHGMQPNYVHEAISQNFRMSEVEAAWLRLCLPTLMSENERRAQIAAHYRMCAPELGWQSDHARHVYHLCVMRARDRDDVRQQLLSSGVATSVQYPLSLDRQPAYAHFADERPLPQAQRWAAQCVSVPCFAELTDVEVEQVGKALSRVTG